MVGKGRLRGLCMCKSVKGLGWAERERGMEEEEMACLPEWFLEGW